MNASFIESVGKLHHLIIHFPIVISLLTGIFVFKKNQIKVIQLLLELNIFFSLVAILSGFLLFSTSQFIQEPSLHYQVSLVYFSILVLTYLMLRVRKTLSLLLSFLIVITVAITAHLGASSFFGESFLFGEKTEDLNLIYDDSNLLAKKILQKNCMSCHNQSQNQVTPFDDQHTFAWRALTTNLIQIGSAEKSTLFKKVVSGEMPPNKAKLSPQEIEILEKWINTDQKLANLDRAELFKEKKVWYFQKSSAKNHKLDIDEILETIYGQKLLKKASDQQIKNRISLVTKGYIEKKSNVSLNLESHIQNSIESRDFSETIALKYLSTIHFTETLGGPFDNDQPGAYRYRDYIVTSLDKDYSFKKIIIESLAGDLIKSPDSKNSTYFLVTGDLLFEDIKEENTANYERFLQQKINTISKTFLGTNLQCVFCHDHPNNYISYKDYTQLRSALSDVSDKSIEASYLNKFLEKSIQINKIEDPHRKEEMLNSHFYKNHRFVTSNTSSKINKDFEIPKIFDINQSIRKEIEKKILTEFNIKKPNSRLILSVWLTDEDVGMGYFTARQIVNLVWEQLMGKSLYKNYLDLLPNNPSPIHIDLINHLTQYFIKNNWSIKKVSQYIIQSRAFQQMRSHSEDPKFDFLGYSPRKIPPYFMRDRLISLIREPLSKLGARGIQEDVKYYELNRIPKFNWIAQSNDGEANFIKSLYLFKKNNYRSPTIQPFLKTSYDYSSQNGNEQYNGEIIFLLKNFYTDLYKKQIEENASPLEDKSLISIIYKDLFNEVVSNDTIEAISKALVKKNRQEKINTIVNSLIINNKFRFIE